MPPPAQALRLIKHIINKGCSQFQRAMQKHANIVRDHMHFKVGSHMPGGVEVRGELETWTATHHCSIQLGCGRKWPLL